MVFLTLTTVRNVVNHRMTIFRVNSKCGPGITELTPIDEKTVFRISAEYGLFDFDHSLH